MLPYQEAPSPPMNDALRDACARAMHVLSADGGVHVGEDSVIYVYEALGWPVWPLRLPPLRWVTPPAYRFLANNRRLFARFFFRPG